MNNRSHNIFMILLTIIIILVIASGVTLALYYDVLDWFDPKPQVQFGNVTLDDDKTNLTFNPELKVAATTDEELIADGSEITITAHAHSDMMYVRVKCEYILSNILFKQDAEAVEIASHLDPSFDDFTYKFETVNKEGNYRYHKHDGWFYLVNYEPDSDGDITMYPLIAGEMVLFMESYKITSEYEDYVIALTEKADYYGGDIKIQITVQAIQEANVVTDIIENGEETIGKACPGDKMNEIFEAAFSQ